MGYLVLLAGGQQQHPLGLEACSAALLELLVVWWGPQEAWEPLDRVPVPLEV